MGCLQKHIQSKHEDIKYPCNQYDKQFTGKGHLKKHIQSERKVLSILVIIVNIKLQNLNFMWKRFQIKKASEGTFESYSQRNLC